MYPYFFFKITEPILMGLIIGDLHDGLPETGSRTGPVKVAANDDIVLQNRPRSLPSKSLVIFHITFYQSMFYSLRS